MSCEAQEVRLRQFLSYGNNEHLMFLVVCQVLGFHDHTIPTGQIEMS